MYRYLPALLCSAIRISRLPRYNDASQRAGTCKNFRPISAVIKRAWDRSIFSRLRLLVVVHNCFVGGRLKAKVPVSGHALIFIDLVFDLSWFGYRFLTGETKTIFLLCILSWRILHFCAYTRYLKIKVHAKDQLLISIPFPLFKKISFTDWKTEDESLYIRKLHELRKVKYEYFKNFLNIYTYI